MAYNDCVKIGYEFSNRYGETFKVVGDSECRIVAIIDNYGRSYKKDRYSIISKNIMTPYSKSYYGVGYLGEGPYDICVIGSGDINKCGAVWTDMLRRCYKPYSMKKFITYKDCSVCDEWHNFQNFAEWFYANYKDGMQIDKDLLKHGNKVYCPENCCFVPQEINKFFTDRIDKRGDYGHGVRMKPSGNFAARIKFDGKEKSLGTFKTLSCAKSAYKTAKEEIAVILANRHKDIIGDRIYNAMINYKYIE